MSRNVQKGSITSVRDMAAYAGRCRPLGYPDIVGYSRMIGQTRPER